MIKNLFIFLLFLTSLVSAQQNLRLNYTPLKCTGSLPAVFTQNIQSVIEKDLDTLYKSEERDKRIKANYMVAANYQIERIIRSGNVLLNDEISAYLNNIVDVILKDDPQLRKEITVYTLRSPVVNAYSFEKGYIFVDIGLIAQAETEAQLAYLLCHEITHYALKHSINEYVRDVKIDRKKFDGKSYEDKLIEKCQYSRKLESEADVYGFRFYLKTNYNLQQAPKLLDVLRFSELPFEAIDFTKDFFETDNFKIPEKYMLSKVSPLTDHTNDDDTKNTHPNTAKRKQTVIDLVASASNEGRVNNILGEDKFNYARDLARFEICRLYLKYRDYPNALYSAYILNKKYPENQYIQEIISKCLYAIALYDQGKLKYNSESYLPDGILTTDRIEGYPQKLYYFINNVPVNEWVILSLNYVYRKHRLFPESQMISECADSLFSMIGKTDWGIKDFNRGIKQIVKTDTIMVTDTSKTGSKTDQMERELKKYEQEIKEFEKSKIEKEEMDEMKVYYKHIYKDLFETDTVFERKFPAKFPSVIQVQAGSPQKSLDEITGYDIFSKKIKINKVLLLEPYYVRYDVLGENEIKYISSDNRQAAYTSVMRNCAKKNDVELEVVDPRLMLNGDVEKLNDYSAINDWLDEKMDSDQQKSYVFTSKDINDVVNKYGTQYILKTGVVSVTFLHLANTYFFTEVFDTKTNEIIYKRYEMVPHRDRQTVLKAKAYELMYELKRGTLNAK